MIKGSGSRAGSIPLTSGSGSGTRGSGGSGSGTLIFFSSENSVFWSYFQTSWLSYNRENWCHKGPISWVRWRFLLEDLKPGTQLENFDLVNSLLAKMMWHFLCHSSQTVGFVLVWVWVFLAYCVFRLWVWVSPRHAVAFPILQAAPHPAQQLQGLRPGRPAALRWGQGERFVHILTYLGFLGYLFRRVSDF